MQKIAHTCAKIHGTTQEAIGPTCRRYSLVQMRDDPRDLTVTDVIRLVRKLTPTQMSYTPSIHSLIQLIQVCVIITYEVRNATFTKSRMRSSSYKWSALIHSITLLCVYTVFTYIALIFVSHSLSTVLMHSTYITLS